MIGLPTDYRLLTTGYRLIGFVSHAGRPAVSSVKCQRIWAAVAMAVSPHLAILDASPPRGDMGIYYTILKFQKQQQTDNSRKKRKKGEREEAVQGKSLPLAPQCDP